MLTLEKGLALLVVLIAGFFMFAYLLKNTKPNDTAIEIQAFFKNRGSSVIKLSMAIFLIILVFALMNWSIENDNDPELEQVVTIEKLTNMEKKNGFCKSNSNDSQKLEKKCNQLSKKNCNVVDCCVYLNNSKCVAGDSSGPKFLTDKEGNDINIDTYYFKNKCHGKKC